MVWWQREYENKKGIEHGIETVVSSFPMLRRGSVQERVKTRKIREMLWKSKYRRLKSHGWSFHPDYVGCAQTCFRYTALLNLSELLVPSFFFLSFPSHLIQFTFFYGLHFAPNVSTPLHALDKVGLRNYPL